MIRTISLGLLSWIVLVPCAWVAGTMAEETSKGLTWPDTHAGRFARALIAAFEAEDEDAFRKFAKSHYSAEYLEKQPIEEEIGAVQEIRKQLGALEVEKIDSRGEYSIELIARATRIGIWVKVDLEFDEDPPHDPVGTRITPTRAPHQEKKDYSEWKGLQQLADTVRRDAGAPALAVALVRDGVLFEKAVSGVRSAGGDRAAGIGDRFHIGSVTKSMTASVVGKLVETEEISFDLTVGETLDDLSPRDEYRPVTLEQLLQHRGGIPGMPTTGEFEEGYPRKGRSPQEGRLAVARTVLAEKPAAEPGTQSTYSNSGYVVLTVMVERKTGKTWEELMRRHLFEPLGLTTAAFGWPATKSRPDQPRGHFGAPPDLRVQGFDEPALGGMDITTFFAPAGDVHCSIGDLARYAGAHLEGLRGETTFLKPETIRRLHTPLGSSGASGNDYAAGWVLQKTSNGEPVHWHNGSGGTFFTLVSIYPESDLAIVLCTNLGLSASSHLEAMTEAIHRRLGAVSSDPGTPGRSG